MTQPEQSYQSHRRYHPLFHFIGVPILTINFVAQIYNAVKWPSMQNIWQIVVAAALLISIFLARYYALRNQDRIIRLEETLRLTRCLPDDLKPRIGEVSTDMLLGLRFCADEELPELCRAVLGGEIRSRDELKRRIRSWRPDYRRV
jgi:hypothetical protein